MSYKLEMTSPISIPYFTTSNASSINFNNLQGLFDDFYGTANPSGIRTYDNLITDTTNSDYEVGVVNVIDVQEFFETNIRSNFFNMAFSAFNYVNVDTLESFMNSTPELYDIVNFISNEISLVTDVNNLLKLMIKNVMNSLESFRILNVIPESDTANAWFIWFINQFPEVTFNLDESVLYNLLFHTKPFHTELYTEDEFKIISDNSFNTVVPKDEYVITTSTTAVSMYTLSDGFEIDATISGVDYSYSVETSEWV
jgi:hypothetical protein